LTAFRLASTERREDIVGITRCRSESAVFPGRPAVHDGIVQREVAVATDLGIEEEEKMNAACAVVDVRFEPRKHGVDLLPEWNAVVVVSLIPLVDDLPDRTGLGRASGPR